MSAVDFGNWLGEAVRALGGVSAGCLLPESLDRGELRSTFERWNAAGNAGLLHYMDASLERRTDPFAERPWARNVIVVAFAGDWGDRDKAPKLDAGVPKLERGGACGRISAYACGPDYHRTGHELLRGLAAKLAEWSGKPEFQHEATVDTRPVPEVFLAIAAGLGVRGRNGLLRTPQRGCRVFVGVLFTELELPAVRRHAEFAVSCAECGACVKNCPTGALGADGVIRVARCRSYLGMEYRGAFTPEQKELLGDALFGCDACTACCPEKSESKRQNAEGRSGDIEHQASNIEQPTGNREDASNAAGNFCFLPSAFCFSQPGIPVDLDFILSATGGEIGRRIRGTALEHAGAKLLKRNAAAIRGDGL